ncbi:MAG: hypothetical protein HGJ94_18260 [Desulfosarcina sp.]|nr:hypothetical protein [Desulfosarcina sp.]
MLTAEEKQEMRDLVAEAVVAALQNGRCTCNLSPAAQGELSHLMGMVKDIGEDSYSAGIETLRQNSLVFSKFRCRVDKFAQRIAWLIIAGVVVSIGGGFLWLLKVGCSEAIKAARG